MDEGHYHSPRSRPKPLRFFPPQGAWVKVGCEQLIQTIPAWKACSKFNRKKNGWVSHHNKLISFFFFFFWLKKEILLSVKMFSPLPHDHIYRDLLIRRLRPNHTCKKLLPYKLKLQPFIQSSKLQLLAEMRIQLTWCHLLVQWLLLQLQMSSHTGLVQRLPLSRFAWMYLCP